MSKWLRITVRWAKRPPPDCSLETRPRHRGVEHDLADLVLDVTDDGDPVGLGDELRQPDELIAQMRHVGDAREPLPQSERMGDHRRALDITIEEHALVWHVDVV